VFDGLRGRDVDWRRHVRAFTLALRRRHDDAAQEYRLALEADPTDPPALFAVLRDCRQRGAVGDAMAVANRALVVDPSNFPALDGLAWAYLQQHDHHSAKPLVERAVKAFDALDVRGSLTLVPRLLLGVFRFVSWLPGLRGRLPTLPPTPEIEAAGSRGVAEWRAWAVDYLAWYGREYGSGPTQAH
jgi:tetratricopeptide (TPR) repeat protein